MFEDYPYSVPVTPSTITAIHKKYTTIVYFEIMQDYGFDVYQYYFRTPEDKAKFIVYLWSIGVDP